MTQLENQRFVKATYFTQAQMRLTRLAGRFFEDAQAVVAEAEAIFDAMLPTMAYVDKPQHPLAAALFICNVNLSLYLALKQRGVDAHAFGNALLNGLMRAPIPPRPQESEEALQERLQQFALLAQESQINAQPGEDVFEVVHEEAFDWGYNIQSCALCHSASQHNAMEVVPYMCAVDDVMSDKNNQGLRRTGSIALGASHCDFRYQRGRQPQRLAEQYPNLIRISTSDVTR
ncbi:MAG TPA: L-2-amino-thiazoline-4-carboxylic acid hydrolase [Blastocatellia bacterium]|nr:L-2-amino-thiazoline-4-carboxylic acid hydrolase [Blastocatellia bacterium]